PDPPAGSAGRHSRQAQVRPGYEESIRPTAWAAFGISKVTQAVVVVPGSGVKRWKSGTVPGVVARVVYHCRPESSIRVAMGSGLTFHGLPPATRTRSWTE